ncbi:MAG TPA: GNAT family N-acetyltransferase, partial [Anaerolineales bacterium]
NLFCYARRSLYVEQIAVQEEYQGRGFGRALIDAAGRLARELGIPKIELDAWAFNKKAQAFFSARGFEKAREIMVLKI